MYIVYKFLDKYDHVLYVGQTKNFEKRLSQHLKGTTPATKNLMGDVTKIYLQFCSSKFHMDNNERFYINKYRPVGNSADKYLLSEKPILALYEENPWVLYKDNKVNVIEILEKQSLYNEIYKDEEPPFKIYFTLSELENYEKCGKELSDESKEDDSDSYLVKFLHLLYDSRFNQAYSLNIENHEQENTEEEIKNIVNVIYSCLKYNRIICPKLHVLKKEYYDKTNPKELKKVKYMMCMFDEPFYEYKVLKGYIADCPKNIKDLFRCHIPFSFEYEGDIYCYDGNTFFQYEELFPLNYIKEVAEYKSSRGQAERGSFLVLEEFDDLGDNNDSYYICKGTINEKSYISSFENFSEFFYCHEYIDQFFYDKYSFEESIYKRKNTLLLTYDSKEIDELLNFEVIKIYE